MDRHQMHLWITREAARLRPTSPSDAGDPSAEARRLAYLARAEGRGHDPASTACWCDPITLSSDMLVHFDPTIAPDAYGGLRRLGDDPGIAIAPERMRPPGRPEA